jgi:hypothetical protein
MFKQDPFAVKRALIRALVHTLINVHETSVKLTYTAPKQEIGCQSKSSKKR